MQVIFFVIIILLLGINVVFTVESYRFNIKASAEKPEGYTFTSIRDFWIMLVSGPVFFLAETLLCRLFYNLFLPHCKEQVDIEKRNIRSQKAALCMYKFTYFLLATGFGYYVLKDQDYLCW